jgi:hypothetical protein
MNKFNELSVADRQAAVNAVLVPATKLLPARIRRNPAVMGKVVAFVWTQFKTGVKVTKTAIARQAKSLEASIAATPTATV